MRSYRQLSVIAFTASGLLLLPKLAFAQATTGTYPSAVYVLPDAGVTPIVRFIQQAQGHLVINNYFIDQSDILQAISQRVQEDGPNSTTIIIEPRPYGMSQRLVGEEMSDLQQTGAQLVDAPSRFEYDHAKYAVATNEMLINTANWSNSAFTRNREYIFTSSDPTLIAAMTQIADADINGQQEAPSPYPLVIAPQSNVVVELTQVIDQPGPVGIETEEVQPNNPIIPVLEQKGANAYLLVPVKLTDREQDVIADLVQAGVHVREIDQPYMHAKIITGKTMTFLGSENFSTASLTENREVGIVLQSAQYMAATNVIANQFNKDWISAGDGGRTMGGLAPDAAYAATTGHDEMLARAGSSLGHALLRGLEGQ